jgi:Ca-activated chloride channel family protein
MPVAVSEGSSTTSPSPGPAAVVAAPAAAAADATWVGVAGDSNVVLARGGEAFLGVWVDVPASRGSGSSSARAKVRPPVDLALVIDTSGSMEGAKIEAARASAHTLVDRLEDGDIVSIDTFSDRARTLVPPVKLTPQTRSRVLSKVAELRTEGSTNMFEGLELAEAHVAQVEAQRDRSPAPVRRIVMISDGQANVGPSSPQALGELAARSLSLGAQVTSLGVGLDYDEHTLNAIAERASGRLFHVGDPRELNATLQNEVDLLRATVATDAAIEVVPAPGVQLLDVEGARGERGSGGSVRIPLGALFAGQHREALVRVRVGESSPRTQRALASVRLVFRDPAQDDVERVQEVLARATSSDDPAEVAAQANATTHAMMATLAAAKTELQAAQDVGSGNFAQAQERLAQAEEKVRAQAASTKDAGARKKLDATAQSLAAARATAAAAPAAPPAAVRDDALRMNGAAMKAMGY